MDENPIYTAVVEDTGFDPHTPYMEPKNPEFAKLGYKARKRISGYANRALADAGLFRERPNVIETAAVRKDVL